MTHPSKESIAVQIPLSTKTVRFWSAVLATAFSITYIVGQFAEWLGLLGAQGDPASGSAPLGLVVLLTPSLFLSSSFFDVLQLQELNCS